MSSQDVTTTGLINTIRMLASVPNNEQLSSDDNTLLNFLNFEMTNSLVPHLMAVREEYFVDFKDFNNYQDPGTGIWQDYYDVPYNAIGMKLRDLTMVYNGAGVDMPPSSRFIPRISPEDVAGYNRFTASSGNSSLAFYMRGNGIVFFPCPKTVNTFRMSYFRQPNYLVSTSEAGQIISIDTNANTVVLSNVPATWATGNTVDVIQYRQGFGFDAQDLEIKMISSPTLEFDTVTNLKVGDWVALSGNSPIPQLPISAHAVLAQAVVVKLLESNKDSVGVQIAQAKYKELMDVLDYTLTPRVDGEPVRITSGGRGLSDVMRNERGWRGYRR